MVKNSIKVYGRIKKRMNKKTAHIQNYDIRKLQLYEEIRFNTDTSGDYGFYKNSRHRFRFCSLFDESATQVEVFDNIAKPVVNSVLEGYNGTIFAYGQTGSGKTYSMTGASEYESRGIIPRTIQHIFEYIRNSTTILYSIYISYLEIYNEIGYDLLNPRNRAAYLEDLPRVTILEDAKGQTHLRNLGVISVASEREAMCLLFLGDTNRTIAETPMNMYSSRSHCIFTVYVSATMTEDGRVRRSKLHLVDLAGSERIQKSGISGTLLVDAKQINLSLHYLEQVIIALSDEKRAHVPYRNSFMTSVLKDSLGGNCLTAMLATLSAEPKNFEETISTCKFAQRVALVSSEAYINEDEDPEVRIGQLKMEIENLKKELFLYKDSSMHSLKSRFQEQKEMSPEEYKECEKLVTNFITSPSDNFPVDDDYSKILVYFKVFKRIIKSQLELINIDKTNNKPLADVVKQKDNEITILAHLLSKEKLKTKEAELKIISEGSKLSASSSSDDKLSEKEAFDLFLSQDNNKSELKKCTSALQQKIDQAKYVANRIKQCKNNIVGLKIKLRENINNGPDSNKYMKLLQSQQDIYRDNIIDLRNLKMETDHLTHAFHQEKLRTMKRFQEWLEKENLDMSKSQIPSIPSFLSSLFNHDTDVANLFSFASVNKFNEYKNQDIVSLNSDQFIPHLNDGNLIDLPIDNFPSFYDSEPSYSQDNEVHNSSEENYDEESFKSLSYENEYKVTVEATYEQPSLNKLQAIQQSNSYSNHSRPASDNRKSDCFEYKKTQSSQKYDNFYSETIPKQFTPLLNAITHYSGHENNVQCQYDIPQNQPCFSGSSNYHHYLESNQPNCMDYDLPEKLSDSSNMLSQYSDHSSTYYRYYPLEQIESTYIDASSGSSDNIKITETQIEDKNSAEFLKSIPLTGDPEVDEEILAFYRAKKKISHNE